MNPRIASSMFAAACVAAASAAHALPLTDRTSIELFAGGNVSTPGSFRGPAFIEGPNGNTDYTRLSYDDAYKHDYTTGVELAFNVNSHVSAFAQADYSQFDGQSPKIGELDSPSAGQVPVEARFGDSDSVDFDVGARYNFTAPGEQWRPFVGAALGAKRMSDTFATVNEAKIQVSKADTVFQQRLEAGLQYSPMPNFGLRLTAAAMHVDGTNESKDPAVSLLGLDSADSGIHQHWEYPAELGAVWYF
jgi:hypothetical protein